jgi:hypothetical protein
MAPSSKRATVTSGRQSRHAEEMFSLWPDEAPARVPQASRRPAGTPRDVQGVLPRRGAGLLGSKSEGSGAPATDPRVVAKRGARSLRKEPPERPNPGLCSLPMGLPASQELDFLPPFRPASAFWAFVPPARLDVVDLPRLDDFFPPLLEEFGSFAMRAARCLLIPFLRSPSYCLSFLTLGP